MNLLTQLWFPWKPWLGFKVVHMFQIFDWESPFKMKNHVPLVEGQQN